MPATLAPRTLQYYDQPGSIGARSRGIHDGTPESCPDCVPVYAPNGTVNPDPNIRPVPWCPCGARHPVENDAPMPDGGSHGYRIVRHYFASYRKRTMAEGLTLAQAQRHCSDPETSSSTATGKNGRATTRRVGAWFDGYTDR